MPRTGVVHAHVIGRHQAHMQYRRILGSQAVNSSGQKPHRLTLRDVDTVQQGRQSLRRDLTLRMQLAPPCELSATAYNVFDKEYGDPGSTEHRQDVIEQNGRQFRLKIDYWF